MNNCHPNKGVISGLRCCFATQTSVQRLGHILCWLGVVLLCKETVLAAVALIAGGPAPRTPHYCGAGQWIVTGTNKQPREERGRRGLSRSTKPGEFLEQGVAQPFVPATVSESRSFVDHLSAVSISTAVAGWRYDFCGTPEWDNAEQKVFALAGLSRSGNATVSNVPNANGPSALSCIFLRYNCVRQGSRDAGVCSWSLMLAPNDRTK